MQKRLLFFLLCITMHITAQEILEEDKNTLIAIYNATDGDNWRSPWDLSESPLFWSGLEFTPTVIDGKEIFLISELNLSSNRLSGSIPPEVENLKDLKSLNLSNNNLSGTIPAELGNLTKLESLQLQRNQLEGEIPSALFSQHETLYREINLSFNKLSGSLPLSLGSKMDAEGTIDLSHNQLTELANYSTSDFIGVQTLNINYNFISFATLEQENSGTTVINALKNNISNLSYTSQNYIGSLESIVFSEGSTHTITIPNFTSVNNTYQWYKDGNAIDGATNTSYQILSATNADIGIYYCEVKNPLVPELTLTRNPYTLDNEVNINEKNALIALYNSTEGINWSYPWDLTSHIENWQGVTLNNEGRITSLFLDHSNLKGILPEEICTLTELESLSLQYNALTGSIPATIANLSKLKIFLLNNTFIGGTIPSGLFEIQTLEYLSFGDKFTGSLSGIENLTNLETIIIYNNSITEIPESFWTISSLEYVFITAFEEPWIKVSFPNSIGQLTSLKKLHLWGNQTQPIPEDFSTLTNLESLWLRGFDAEPIPQNIGNLINLTELRLSDGFSGNIPNSIGNLTKLKTLQMNNNQLTSIPEEIGDLTNLETLQIDNSQLTSIPEEIGNLTNLKTLQISNSQLTSIPQEIENLTSLKSLLLYNNNLEGAIPTSIGNLSNLESLGLGSNNFSGQIPASFGDLSNLKSLGLASNNLSGQIPATIGNLPNLNRLNITYNRYIFEDMEQNIDVINAIPDSFFQIQQDIDEEANITIDEGTEITLSVDATQSPNNLYKWFKDGRIIEGATERNLTITNAGADDVGIYDCFITNSIVPLMFLNKKSITLDVSFTLGTEAFVSAGITTYPIPAQEQLTIGLGDLSGLQVNATIYDLLGNLILTQTGVQNNETINIATLASGSYILQLEESGKTYASMILKQ